MQNLPHNILLFIGQHWAMWLAFVVVVIAVVVIEIRSYKNGGQRLTPQQAVQIMNQKKALVYDLRDAAQFKAGHITGAKNIDVSRHLKQIENEKDKPVILCCGNGQSSQKNVQLLQKLGFELIYVLRGGMDAWRQEKLPTIK